MDLKILADRESVQSDKIPNVEYIIIFPIGTSSIDYPNYHIRSMPAKIAVKLAQIGSLTLWIWQISLPVYASNLLPDSDIPEEVLRAEIIIEARSPIDGSPLSANEFAELVVKTKQQLELDNSDFAATSPKFKEVLFLLRLRGFLKSIGIPIK